MVVSYEVAEYLNKLGFLEETYLKYHKQSKKLHSKFKEWEPVEPIPAPEVMEAVNWIWKKGIKITLREVNGDCSAEAVINGTSKFYISDTPEKAFNGLLEKFATEGVLE